ncbi:uncharacterized protein Z520_01338 [Fonsecaea multimorphosa CBS 102226]|uniref:Uncharacterized protein n=1 Tax=Fonsecaea multimorphosa CBS 102226 TaxID=1442371 RepID=A0A0D2KA16_9EURO|nr:uncharacterized protein Z520_01338 [Fonsecaea multimorphosa CBS 102226]KIY02873.1 hypothetical protein Z520_01338 [Fonsecaea multimorphosa CBS 102226]OAL30710.1 hypothetical protein AYO22_01330 [Fonsecaea multimorphosa]
MTGRRSSARIAAQNQSSQSSQTSSPPHPKPSPAGKKRKNEASGSSPSAKRGKKDAQLEQKTLDETMQQNGAHEQPAPEKADQEMTEPEPGKPEEPQTEKVNGEATEAKKQDEKPKEEESTDKGKVPEAEDVKPEASEPKEVETKEAESKEETKPAETNGDAVEPGAREDDVPSSILEKGVIYFFFRARVNVDHPEDVKDVARSYMVMRPIPLDAKLGDGPIGDQGNCRLLALPKKVLPKSGRDRFVTFVEKCKTSFAELKETFLAGSEYETKTAGTRHTPPVTPLAEGVYAITSTGRESHLAYIVNIPAEIGEMQKDFGLKQRGSFVTSVKNPEQPPLGNQNVPQGPEYPQEIIDEFRGLRWKPLEPKYLEYDNAQFLMIGEDYDKATEQRPKDEREDNAAPEEEMEKLDGEDEIRIKHLKGDDAVFTDLGITSKEFPQVSTTW